MESVKDKSYRELDNTEIEEVSGGSMYISSQTVYSTVIGGVGGMHTTPDPQYDYSYDF